MGEPLPRAVGGAARRLCLGIETTTTCQTSAHTEASMSRKRVTLERTYTADVQDVRDLWTTKDGIESWWGPGGFKVTVLTDPR